MNEQRVILTSDIHLLDGQCRLGTPRVYASFQAFRQAERRRPQRVAFMDAQKQTSMWVIDSSEDDLWQVMYEEVAGSIFACIEWEGHPNQYTHVFECPVREPAT